MRTLIEAESDMQIVGEATDGAEALALAASQKPDVVLMDIKLPDINGIEVTRRIRALQPETRVLVVSMLDDTTVFNALKAGACGYVLKGANGEETLHAIRAAASGEAIFSSEIAQQVMQYFATLPATTAFPELTEREREIQGLLAQGLTNSAIAERLSLSTKTVRNRVSDIFSNLHVSDHAAAIIKARDAGLS